MVTLTPKLGLRNPEDPDDANDAVRVWRGLDNAILDDAVTSAALPGLLPTMLPSANLLINPGMEVWQRGAGPFSASMTYTTDGWRILLGGTATLSLSRDSANADAGSQYCAACTYVHNTASNIHQTIEAYQQLRTRTLTFSARVRTATAAAVRLALYDSVNLQRYSGFHSGSGAYETLSVTAPVAAATTILQVMVGFNASCTAYVDSAVLVVGASAAPFTPLHSADDLARCQRYYYEIGGLSAFEPAGVGMGNVATVADVQVRFPVEMAVAPTASFSAVGDWTVVGADSTNKVVTAIAFNQLTRRSARILFTVAAGLLAGGGAVVMANNTTNARLRFEANP